jgi:hypothetical protein
MGRIPTLSYVKLNSAFVMLSVSEASRSPPRKMLR